MTERQLRRQIERLKKQDQHATANAVDLAFDSLLALDQIIAERDIAFELLERFDIILGQNADYIKYLMKKYNVPIANVRTHAEVTNYGKTCPNWSANSWQRWKNFKSKLVSPSTTTSVKVGDKVKVKSTATTYANSTKTIPSWVKNGTYTVSKVDSSKVLLKEITSWINVNDVSKVSTTTTTTTTSYLVRVTVDSLNVRKSPSTSSAIITTVKKGGVYTIVEVSNGWGKLKSNIGWISLDCTEKIK